MNLVSPPSVAPTEFRSREFQFQDIKTVRTLIKLIHIGFIHWNIKSLDSALLFLFASNAKSELYMELVNEETFMKDFFLRFWKMSKHVFSWSEHFIVVPGG